LDAFSASEASWKPWLDWAFSLIPGNYPPAEPGALDCEPLKAAGPGSLTRPRLKAAA